MTTNRRTYRARLMDSQWYLESVRCQAACPVNTRAGGYIQAIARGYFKEAADLARRPNPLAGICGRVCGHPCEAACRRGAIDQPVSIRALKRYALETGGLGETARPAGRRAETVAVVGAGPAGLAAAHDLAVLGYGVTLFEAESVAGGMASLGIPEFRLPRAVVQEEAEQVLSLGVEFRPNQRLGLDFGLEDLMARGFRAVVVAVGLQRGRGLMIEGHDAAGVLIGLDLLKQVSLGHPPRIGPRVLVVGGGSVAMDVARVAIRLGAQSCTAVSLESRREMPAPADEVEEAEREGVQIVNSRGPKRFLTLDGVCTGLETLDVASVFDEQGRFRPTFREGTEKVLEADTVLLAIGQGPDPSLLALDPSLSLGAPGPSGSQQPDLSTEVPGIFRAGDYAYGPRLLIDAIASGRRAAWSVHRYLGGREGVGLATTLTPQPGWLRTNPGLTTPRQAPPTLAPVTRGPIAEVEAPLTPRQALAEADRCLRCSVSPWVDAQRCILCGGCADICPSGCIHFAAADEVEGDQRVMALVARPEAAYGGRAAGSANSGAVGWTVMLKDDTRCIRCGLCAHRCPTGAMTMMEMGIEEATIGD